MDEKPEITADKVISPRHRSLRIGIALLVGLIVCGIAIVEAYDSLCGESYRFGSPQSTTFYFLNVIPGAICSYQDKYDTLPASLEDLKKFDEVGLLRYDENGKVCDGWGRPFLYTVDGTRYVVTSYGKDGKPGGTGMDCDLSTIKLWPRGAVPTFLEFFFDMKTGGITWSCILSGILAALLTGYFMKIPASTPGEFGKVAVKIFCAAVGSLIAAAVMSFHHIPKGH